MFLLLLYLQKTFNIIKIIFRHMPGMTIIYIYICKYIYRYLIIYLFIILQFFYNFFYLLQDKNIVYFYWRYGKVLRSTSCERPSLNASVVVLFVIFSVNLFLLFCGKTKMCNCLYYIGFV